MHGEKDDNDNEKQVSIKSAYDCNGLGNKENDIKHEEVKEDDDGRSGGNKVVVWYGAQGSTAHHVATTLNEYEVVSSPSD